MTIREELKQAAGLALEDPKLAHDERSFREAIRRALRKSGAFTTEQVVQLADEFVITDKVRCALLQNELIRLGGSNGCEDVALLREIAIEAFSKISRMKSQQEMVAVLIELLEAQEIEKADNMVQEISLDLIFPEPALQEGALSRKAMKEQELRGQLLSMVYDVFESSLGREKATERAEEFVLLFLGPPDSEATGNERPSLLSVIEDQVTTLIKHADDPIKKKRVIAGIQQVMNAYARPSFDTYLFVKLIDTHGKQFLYTVQDAILNNVGTSKDKNEFQSFNLQV